MSRAQRAVLLGVDGANYEAIRPLLSQGRLPHLQRLINEGTLCANALSPYPNTTGSLWATIATGAWPGTHGVTDMSYHVTGEPLDHWHSGFTSDAVEAETLWEAAARQGKKAIVLKYTGSWPPRDERVIMVDGGGGRPFWGGSVLALSHSQVFSTQQLPNGHSIATQSAVGWQHPPPSRRPPLEAHLSFVAESGRVPDDLRFGEHATRRCEPIPLHLLLSACGDNGFDTIHLCRTRDASRTLCVLRSGQWSDTMIWDFQTGKRTVGGGVRVKAQKIDPESGDMVLFFPQVYPVDAFCQPASLGAELVGRFGAYVNHPGFSASAMGWFENDPETFMELMDYQNGWLGDAGQYLLENNEWDLFAMQAHCIDFANHAFVPRHGWSDQQCSQGLANLARCYESVDRMIGQIVAGVGEEAVIAVASDHGATQSPCPEVFVNPILAEAGLLAFEEGAAGSDRLRVDLGRTQAVQQRCAFIYVNLEGREPNGIVQPEEYEAVRQRVIDALRAYREPETGQNPFSMVLGKEDAYMLGLFDSLGRDIGDVVYAVRPQFDHEHGRQLPNATLGGQTMKPLLILNGSCVKKGHVLQRPVWLVDVAPTICRALGVDPPTETDGGFVYQAFADHQSRFPRPEKLDQQPEALAAHVGRAETRKGRHKVKAVPERVAPPEEAPEGLEEPVPNTVPKLQAALRKAREEARRWKQAYDRYHRITHGN